MDNGRIKVTAFTGGINVPGARFRVRQYIPALAQLGIDIAECPARFGCYPPRAHAIRPLWAVATLAQRLPGVMASYRSDVTFFQRELISTLVTFEWLTKGPRILDVDDAIWLHSRGGCARKLAEAADVVICGNSYLASHFEAWNNNIAVISTAVDTQRYRPRTKCDDSQQVIGWSGTSSGLKFLQEIEPALAEVLKRRPQAKLRIVSDRPPELNSIPPKQIEFVRWSESKELELLQSMTIGLMPLDDSPWSRGKCSYKMLLYMACGVPVIASDLGMNHEVFALGRVGFGARSLTDWSEAIETTLDTPNLACLMGQTGRQVVEKYFSISVTAPKLATAVRCAVNGN